MKVARGVIHPLLGTDRNSDYDALSDATRGRVNLSVGDAGALTFRYRKRRFPTQGSSGASDRRHSGRPIAAMYRIIAVPVATFRSVTSMASEGPSTSVRPATAPPYFRPPLREGPVTRLAPCRVAAPSGQGFLLLAFAGTLFASATLLFLVQPMVGKMILPALGGTPAVWNTCMLFFQAMLLGGYAFAHVTTSWLGVRRQALLQLVLLLLPLSVLPILMAYESGPPASANPVFWLLGRLFVAVGLPFFVVSTTGPLLQKWFADTGHASAKDPYFLYAASNAGSLLALLGYPLLLQPALPLGQQSALWALAYVALIAMIAFCAVLLWRSPRGTATRSGLVGSRSHPDTSSEAHSLPYGRISDDSTNLIQQSTCPTVRRRMWWVLTAFVPSSLMLGVTAHITTNLAPVPLLWVLPLAIYLLTFVLVFARRPLLPDRLMVRLLPLMIIPAGGLLFLPMKRPAELAILIQLLTFFLAAMVCHGALARSRPAARHLTEFYLWMSIGGVLGGVFNAIVAPMAFNSVVEYPLVLVLACMLASRTGAFNNGHRLAWADIALPGVIAGGFSAVVLCMRVGGWDNTPLVWVLVFGGLILVVLSLIDRPVRFGLGYGVFLLATAHFVGQSRGTELSIERNFFGVKRVVADADGRFLRLFHGSTIHGAQAVDRTGSPEPLAYYHRTGPIGDCFAVLNGLAMLPTLESVNTTRPLTGGEDPLVPTPAGNQTSVASPLEHGARADAQVAVIGLGVGAVAAYAKPGQHFTFYEIDPAVERIARDRRYFTFLEQCKGSYEVVIGDGRLTIGQAPEGHFDMIVLDAFSSDAVPTHLLTREAIRLYLDKLATGGVLVFHISNRYLDLTQLVGGLADDAGLACVYRDDRRLTKAELAGEKQPSIYVAMARSETVLAPLIADANWSRLQAHPAVPVWTDQYSSVLRLFR